MTSAPEPRPGAFLEPALCPPASVVVPTFRRPRALGRCLEALARLEYPRDRLEIVIVDDGGGDLSPSLPGKFAPDLRVRIVTQENRGPAAARNHGASEAAGDLLAFTDDDCCPRPAWLAGLAAEVVAEPRVLAGGRVENGLRSNLFSEASQDLVSFLYEYFPDGRALLPFFTSNNIACDRTAFLALGGFDQTFRFSAAEDRDFSERWMAEVGPLRHVPAAVVDHYHLLSARGFLRQHHYYGRGAVHLARRRRRRGVDMPRPEPLSFYGRMLAHPVRHHGWLRGIGMAGLVGLAQLSGLTGMAVEAIHPSYREK